MRQQEELARLLLDPSNGERCQFRTRLYGELNHRVKNTLAIIQSIAMQILRGDDTPPVVREAFMARLVALADAYDVLTTGNWECAELGTILAQAVGMHQALPGGSKCAGA